MGYDLYRDLEIIKVVNEMFLSDYCSFKYRLIPVSVHLFIEASLESPPQKVLY